MKQSNVNSNSKQYNTNNFDNQNLNMSLQKTNYNNLSQHINEQQDLNNISQEIHSDSYRRNSKLASSNKPLLGATHQSSIDYFDHYKRPPSRDSSVDRYTRATSRLGGSRQPSVDRNTATIQDIDKTVRSGSLIRNSSTGK